MSEPARYPTYDKHLAPFDKIEIAEQQVQSSKEFLLQQHGWTHTSQTPGCRWMWQKQLPDGRTLLVDTDTALRCAREAAAAFVDPAELDG